MKYLPDIPHRNQTNNSPLCGGYTIIEIIIAVFILIIIFSFAQANYRQFIYRKSLESVKSQIVSDIKLARVYALTGKKSSTCTGWAGYLFFINPTNYSIVSDCATDEIVKTVQLPSIAKGVTSATTRSVLFKALGKGTSLTFGTDLVITLSQQTTGAVSTITITSGGEIR